MNYLALLLNLIQQVNLEISQPDSLPSFSLRLKQSEINYEDQFKSNQISKDNFFKKKTKKFKDEIRKQNKKNQRKKIKREMLYCSYEQ